MRSRALLTSGIYFPDIGGPATFLPKLAKHLTKQGFEVTTFSLSDTPNQLLPSEPWTRVFSKRNRNKYIRFLLVIYKLYKLIDSETIIFANGLHEEVAIAAFLHGRKAGIAKIVGDPVWERARNRKSTNLGIEEFNYTKLKCNQRFQRSLLRMSLNRYELITTPSQQLRSLVELWGVNSNVKVITNGVDLVKKIEVEPEYDICTISRLVPWKNLDLLIESCHGLGLKICVVGSGPEKDKLIALAKDKNVNVEFMGELDADDVSTILRKSRCYCLISTYEGLSFSLLEAMAHGIPVIVSNATGNKAVIEHNLNGIVLQELTKEMLREEIVHLLGDELKQNELGSAAIETIRMNYLLTEKLSELTKYLVE